MGEGPCPVLRGGSCRLDATVQPDGDGSCHGKDDRLLILAGEVLGGDGAIPLGRAAQPGAQPEIAAGERRRKSRGALRAPAAPAKSPARGVSDPRRRAPSSKGRPVLVGSGLRRYLVIGSPIRSAGQDRTR